ncbi:MAG: hypothetical protein JWM36_3952 [Hyphomicrobiales bacterium]|jgi:hypothetical protein|nr:hypothetical protein [Hyphomicrobiales bacterium]
MRELRSKFVVWDQIGGGNYIMIAHGDGVYEKKEGFRSRREAEDWIERRLRKSRLESLEDSVFAEPWLRESPAASVH